MYYEWLTGLEPATFALARRRSRPTELQPHDTAHIFSMQRRCGRWTARALSGIRTPVLLLTMETLYPLELKGHFLGWAPRGRT